MTYMHPWAAPLYHYYYFYYHYKYTTTTTTTTNTNTTTHMYYTAAPVIITHEEKKTR